jgi:hypothetical protein
VHPPEPADATVLWGVAKSAVAQRKARADGFGPVLISTKVYKVYKVNKILDTESSVK